MKEINCLICGKKKPPSKAHTQLCGNSQCGKELSLRKREEAKKWEITPEVKAHFSTFYSLMKKRTQGKARPCLKCRRMVLQNRLGENRYRLCRTCQDSNEHIGALASEKGIESTMCYTTSASISFNESQD
jgi:hypothetical protein